MKGASTTEPRGSAIILKKQGQTPLEALKAWKEAHPELKGVAVSYAGRLDPMATGKILVLYGEECKRQHLYTKLDKEYEIEVLLDVASDTGDVLGMGTYAEKISTPTGKEVRDALAKERGTHMQAYPAFSSKTVQGKPLFLYTLEGMLSEIQIPTHPETIYKIEELETYRIEKGPLLSRMINALAHVSRSDAPSKKLGADFRQDAIRARWIEVFELIPNRTFTVLKLRVTCASGTYMRTLAERIGASLGATALALSIDRTKIGKYIKLPFGGIWIQRY